MDFLRALDIRLFYSINTLPHTWFSDVAGEALSGFGYAWMLWLIIGSTLFFRKERKDHWFWVPFFLAMMLSYVFSEVFFKQMFCRVRPGILDGALIVGVLPAGFSFPSTHATVAFASSYLFSRKETHWMWIYGLAFLVGFSRIYLGHHYPIDVVAGALLGTLIGITAVAGDTYLHRIHQRHTHSTKKKRGKRI